MDTAAKVPVVEGEVAVVVAVVGYYYLDVALRTREHRG